MLSLHSLMTTPEIAARYCEAVDVSFHGYEGTTAELWEITEVRDFVVALDEQFSYWLYFSSRRTSSLQAILLCLLPPHLSAAGKAKVYPGAIQDLMLRRWIPALNAMADFTGTSEAECNAITDRAAAYVRQGPIVSPR